MPDQLRRPFFIVALILITIVVLVELGSTTKLGALAPADSSLSAPRPGKGIPSLALLDGLVLYVSLIVGLALIIPERIQGRLQGIATLVFSIVMLLADIGAIFAALALLILMVTLLLSPIFGTIAYFALYSNFDTTHARILLGLLMTLKLLFAVCLVLAHERFLQNKTLVLLVASSVVATFVVGLLQGFPARVLASITDDIGAIIVALVAAVWAIVFLVSSVVSIVKAVT